MTRRLLLCLIRLCLLMLAAGGRFSPAMAAGEAIQLSIDPATSPVLVTGVFDGKASTFTGSARLTLRGAPSATVRLLTTDLLDADQTGARTKINRADVTMPADTRLSENQPVDVVIAINNVKRAGKYSGQLEFVASTTASSTQVATTTVRIDVKIEAQPLLKSVLPNVTLQVVNCRGALDCGLATWLLPKSSVRDHWAIPLENGTGTDAIVSQGVVVMRGEKTGMVAQSREMSIAAPQVITGSLAGSLDLEIARAELPADRYQGSIRLKVDGVEEPLMITSTVEVRNGPLLAILAIIFGIVIGRLVRNRQTPLAQKQGKLFPRLKEIGTTLDAIKDEEMQKYFAAEIESARAKIANSTEDEATTSKFIEEIDTKIVVLLKLEKYEAWLTDETKSKPEQALALAQFQPMLVSVRDNLRISLEAAQQSLKALEEQLAAKGKQPEATPRGGRRGGGTETPSGPGPAPTAESKLMKLTRAGWSILSVIGHFVLGADAQAVEQRFWFVKSLLFLVLLVMLALIGLQSLYVNNGAIFGVNGIYDYVGLFLWGMSAEVAQRTLQDLGSSQSK